MGGPVLIEWSAARGVGVLRLVRPEKRNALSSAMVVEGIAAVDHLVAAGTRVATLEAVGQIFCAGDDISPAEQEPGRVHTADSFIRYVAAAPVFWIAVVDGPALGAGVALAAGCPVVLCGEESWFRLPERDSGNFPEFVVDRIAPLVGIRKAIELATSGTRVSAAEAVTAGLASEAVPSQALRERAAEWVRLSMQQPEVARKAAARWSRIWNSEPGLVTADPS
jgi:enoyl-CoA hydratase/carnithine racemase